MLLQRSGLIALGLLVLTACHTPPPADEASQTPSFDFDNKIKVGRLIAETRCSKCHATGTSGDSPHPEAKPFRFLSENYPIRDLEEPLAEGIVVGHPDMPVFTLSPYEIDSLLTYLQSIQHPLGT
ncbi:MAG: cytochrome c [Hyphomonas sp.]|nr:cytochrome c [Hyphomonas sp.]